MRRAVNGLRRLPPVLVGTLLVMWLLLNQSLALGHIVLGLVLALAVAYASSVLRPVQPRIRRGYLALVLLANVLGDVVRSNISVAGIILGLVRNRHVQSGFVKIPLELRDPHALAVLAGIVTSTPGTVWVDHDVEANVLTLHVLDLRDEAEWIAWLKNPYERLLREIFE
jgi:multicomponent K+:H+ antiporter subunit E